MLSCAFSDSGTSSSEDEGPNKSAAGPGARNGEVKKRLSRSPSPRRRFKEASPRSHTWLCLHIFDAFCHEVLSVFLIFIIFTCIEDDVLPLLGADAAPLHPLDAADLPLPLDAGIRNFY